MMLASEAFVMLSDIENADHRDRLNAWEEEFLLSIGEQVDRGRDLTDKQVDRLFEIYEKASSGFAVNYD